MTRRHMSLSRAETSACAGCTDIPERHIPNTRKKRRHKSHTVIRALILSNLASPIPVTFLISSMVTKESSRDTELSRRR